MIKQNLLPKVKVMIKEPETHMFEQSYPRIASLPEGKISEFLFTLPRLSSLPLQLCLLIYKPSLTTYMKSIGD